MTNPEDPDSVLLKTFGHRAFRAGQRPVIDALLAGESALAIFPTGAGKSLCYQLPALMLPGVTLVVSPLIALMKDQVEALQMKGIPAARLDSSLALKDYVATLDRMESGDLKLLYIAPERLANEGFVERLKKVPIAMMAVDEAHCISEWGHNFRPDYLRLAEVARRLRIHPVLALTATATPEVERQIRKGFRIRANRVSHTGFYRSNLHLAVTSEGDRVELLARRLRSYEGSAIAYVTKQETAQITAAELAKKGFAAAAYHAGLPSEMRSATQERFMAGKIRVVVATIAFGMGIDKADIRAVYHLNLPKTLENYMQEIGRAGRDGLPARCELFPDMEDLTVLESFILGDTPGSGSLRIAIDHLLRRGDQFDISKYDLSLAADMKPLVLETLLAYLELEGVIQSIGSYYSQFKVRLKEPISQILVGHTKARQTFLEALFASASHGRSLLTIDLDTAAAATGGATARVSKALRWLEAARSVELIPSGLRHTYRIGTSSGSVPALVERMRKLFAERERRDMDRLEGVIGYAGGTTCRTNHLLSYFGERRDRPCGHCDRCVDVEVPVRPAGRSQREIEPKRLEQIRSLITERHPQLASDRKLASFLCGLRSPATTRARLTKHPLFGSLEDIPFAEVLRHIQTMVL